MDFSLSEAAKKRKELMRMAAETLMRPISRQYDEAEHTEPWDFFNAMWEASKENKEAASMTGETWRKDKAATKGKRSEATLLAAVQVEELAWGDVGLSLSIPNAGLGGGAVNAAGTPQQKERFLKGFFTGKPRWGAMTA